MPQILGEIVEQDVADAAAEDDPERGVEDQVVGMAAGERRARLLQQLQQVPIADEDAGEVGEAVPPEVERPDVQRHRRKPEVGERDELRVIGAACKDFPLTVLRLIRRAAAKAKEVDEACRASSTAASTRNWRGRRPRRAARHRPATSSGRAIVENFPATLPEFFRAFCALNARQRGGGCGRRALHLRRSRPDFGPRRAGTCRARHREGRPRRHRDAQLPGVDPQPTWPS